MIENTAAHPQISTRDAWRKQRMDLLAQEKALTKQRDRVNASRRRLPMVKLTKEYSFEGLEGRRTLAELFEGSRQLIVYHFMFDPAWDKGCMGCTGFVDALGDLSMLEARDTRFVLVSRAPLAKLEAYKASTGWSVPWYSSYGSDFNYDFHVTLDEKTTPIEYNYQTMAALEARRGVGKVEGEEHGISVFLSLNNAVHHTYSVYARGTEGLTDAYSLLDLTPYGRQEDFEDSPPGWPQKPTYG